MDNTPAVKLTNVAKTYGRGDRKVNAVDNVSLTINKGEIVALLGPNGAGKTTTIDLLLGLIAPDSGTVSVLGKAPRQAITDGQVSALLQTGGLLRDLKVAEVIGVMAALHKVPQPHVDAVIERTKLSGILKRKVAKCSGGEQQRIKFALALLPAPDVLVLDEPTTGMDVNARHEFWHTMQAEAQQGRTVLFATHYLAEAEQFSQRIIFINHGRIVADGPTAEIRALATGRQVSARISDAVQMAEINRLPGVSHIEISGNRISLTSVNSDRTALALLTDFGATDLEIVAPTLDTVFMQMSNPTD